MGVALTFCYFNNLVLARKISNLWQPAIYFVCLAMLPVIFWTHTRSVWLGMIIATMIWMIYTRRHWSRAAGICILVAAAILVFYINMDNFLSERRSLGGWTDIEPVYVRIGLALISLKIFAQHPFVGIGFGHFRDVAPQYATDVNVPYYEFASSAMEHNNFLSLLAETGLIGLVLFVAILILLFRISYRLYKRLPNTAIGPVSRDILVLYWVLFAVYLVDGMFRETSVYPFTNSLFFAFSGVIVALHWLLRPQPLHRTALRPTQRSMSPSRHTAKSESPR
jgi:O-antigen ligase